VQITIKNMGGLIRVRVNDTDLGELKALQPYVLTVPAGPVVVVARRLARSVGRAHTSRSKLGGGDYYDREPPLAGLTLALKIVTLHANQLEWAVTTQAGPADAAKDPAKAMDNKFNIEATLENAAAAPKDLSLPELIRSGSLGFGPLLLDA
jgi:hypothetical protein